MKFTKLNIFHLLIYRFLTKKIMMLHFFMDVYNQISRYSLVVNMLSIKAIF
ncbi:Uncharacterised protein [Bergeyella zoohelcum]|uniref:Uncharacterized protein n=1 Tax=Bergeyella zoohelcum TaxID=1015 RepID=A0A7Z8YLP9_9FLAO|nr:Uncharacterised protein [Bergeyella zoohelcum]